MITSSTYPRSANGTIKNADFRPPHENFWGRSGGLALRPIPAILAGVAITRVTFSRLVPVLENVLYRIVQEGLTNARNHSKSRTILVSLVQRGDRLRIAIRDWGVGFDPNRVPGNRFGVEGIRERARLLGGKCSIRSEPGEGTSILVELPVVERDVD